jgi:hypothetical protein
MATVHPHTAEGRAALTERGWGPGAGPAGSVSSRAGLGVMEADAVARVGDIHAAQGDYVQVRWRGGEGWKGRVS